MLELAPFQASEEDDEELDVSAIQSLSDFDPCRWADVDSPTSRAVIVLEDLVGVPLG